MTEKGPEEGEIQQWRQAYRTLQDGGGLSCPADDRLIAHVLHEHHSAEREQLANHIVGCRRCTDRYQTLLRVHRHLVAAVLERVRRQRQP
jgi:hypothetical protein